MRCYICFTCSFAIVALPGSKITLSSLVAKPRIPSLGQLALPSATVFSSLTCHCDHIYSIASRTGDTSHAIKTRPRIQLLRQQWRPLQQNDKLRLHNQRQHCHHHASTRLEKVTLRSSWRFRKMDIVRQSCEGTKRQQL